MIDYMIKDWIDVAALSGFAIALLILWVGCRRRGYGRAADGAALAAILSLVAGRVLDDSDEVWAYVLLVGAVIALVALFLDKGELK